MDIDELYNKFISIPNVGESIIVYYVNLEFTCKYRIKNNILSNIESVQSKFKLSDIEYDGKIFESDYEDFSINFALYVTYSDKNYIENKVDTVIAEYRNQLSKYYKEIDIRITDIDKDYIALEDLLEYDDTQINAIIKTVKEEINFYKNNSKS